MSYKKPKLTDKKKLCPRCGSPMMTKSETLKYCPVCHFTESSAKTTIKIKIAEDKKEEKQPDIELYQVTASGNVKASCLESGFAYVVVDRNQNMLWMWKGSKCSPGDAYKAGVQTTKLKSALRMYSASIKQVEEGDEPDNFPSITEDVESIEAEQKAKEETEQRAREEEASRTEEAERKAKEEAEQRAREERARRTEEAERKAKEEAEQRAREEKARRTEEAEQEKEPIADTGDIWKKVADNTKPAEAPQDTAPLEEDSELSQAISSLTLVRGINEETAKKLYNANITSIMGLSLSNAEEVATKTSIDISVISELIGNAKDLLGLD
jgi:ribosomal protein S27AE